MENILGLFWDLWCFLKESRGCISKIKFFYDQYVKSWLVEVDIDIDEGLGYVDLTLSQRGENLTTLCEGHDDILANGNYAVIDTGDYKLTTYGGLTITQQTKIAADAWLTSRGHAPTSR